MAVKQSQPAGCPVCGEQSATLLIELPAAPVFCNVLWPAREQALAAPVADIELVRCRQCGHLYNRIFDSSLVEYSQGYENSLHFSELFAGFANELAGRLIEQFDLRQKKVLEIGCGKGEFLAQLCEQGANDGFGFDQSVEQDRIPALKAGSVTFSNEFFDRSHAAIEPDFLCSRHVLEHIGDPIGFLRGIREALGDRAIPVYFEVPNGTLTLVGAALWDIIYEHPAYFGRQSLEYVFNRAGFEVLNVYEQFNDQFLGLEARVAPGVDEFRLQADDELEQAAAAFGPRFTAELDQWRQRIDSLTSDGQRIVLWGAGSKGVSFLNALGRDTVADIDYIVDINVHKHGKFLPGTGQQVVPAEFLADYQPRVVVVMNPAYLDEIRRAAQALGVEATYLCA